ncbi:hypothetical protein LCM08_14680 [Salipiger pacificus]|nr:hypothetical protein [Alloyangia pacifica]MCA0946161.1 hypothetical protein [Alloyangia pacifica]
MGETYRLSKARGALYTFHEPFVAGPVAVPRGYGASKPFGLTTLRAAFRVCALSDVGYPPYGATVTTRRYVQEERADVLERALEANLGRWKINFADPAPCNALIKAANPKMTDEQLGVAHRHRVATGAVTGGSSSLTGTGA